MDLNKIANALVIPQAEMESPVLDLDTEVLGLLNKFLQQKYTLDACYRYLVDRVHGPWRDALVEHWTEHSEDERKMAYDIAMKIVGIGSDPQLPSISIPACSTDINDVITCLTKLELETIETEELIIKMVDNDLYPPELRLLLENHMLLDAHHLDDLTRLSTQVQGEMI